MLNSNNSSNNNINNNFSKLNPPKLCAQFVVTKRPANITEFTGNIFLCIFDDFCGFLFVFDDRLKAVKVAKVFSSEQCAKILRIHAEIRKTA